MKYVIITGAGNGLGYQTTKALVDRGYFVYACDINIDTFKNKPVQNVRPLVVDVTNNKSIVEAYKVIKKISPKIDAIINFAGISLFGSLIETKLESIQKVIDVNLFGTIRMNKVFYYLLKENEGRIINISSENGWQTPSPFNGIYSMSKYALEAYNDSLRRELMFLGIKVIKIQPGSFKSNMHNQVRFQFNEFVKNTKLYPKVAKNIGKSMNRELDNNNDIKYLLEAIYHALESNNPKINYRVKNSKQLSFLTKLSAKKADKLFYKSLK